MLPDQEKQKEQLRSNLLLELNQTIRNSTPPESISQLIRNYESSGRSVERVEQDSALLFVVVTTLREIRSKLEAQQNSFDFHQQNKPDNAFEFKVTEHLLQLAAELAILQSQLLWGIGDNTEQIKQLIVDWRLENLDRREKLRLPQAKDFYLKESLFTDMRFLLRKRDLQGILEVSLANQGELSGLPDLAKIRSVTLLGVLSSGILLAGLVAEKIRELGIEVKLQAIAPESAELDLQGTSFETGELLLVLDDTRAKGVTLDLILEKVARKVGSVKSQIEAERGAAFFI